MASVIESLNKLYSDDNAVPFHIFILTLSAIVAYSVVAFAKLSVMTIITYAVVAIIVGGMCLKVAHNRLNLIENLPEVDEQNFIVAIKYIPVGIVVTVLNVVISLIPILGAIAQFVFGLSVYPIIHVRFCKNYSTKDALNTQKIKEHFGAFIVPCLLLSLKMLLFTILIILPTILATVNLAKNNIFLIVTMIMYIMIINYYIYMDNLAQIYLEVDFYDSENSTELV